MNADYVTVHRTYDPLQADILGDLLRENGIAARVLGTRHGAVIGVGQNILQLHIEVPADQAGVATDFVESFLRGDGLAPGDDHEDDHDEDDDESSVANRDRPRSPLLAAGSVLLLFGGGHLYAQRYWTAAVLAVGQVMAFVRLASHSWSVAASGAAMFTLVLVLDLAGSQIAVRRPPRVGRAALSQLVTGAFYVAVAGTVSAFLGPRIPAPEAAERYYQVEPPPPAPLFVD